MESRFHKTVLGLMLMHVVINSCGYLFVKVGLGEFSPFAFAFWRFLFGLCGLCGIIFIKKVRPRVERGDWGKMLLLAALAVPTNQFLYLSGMKYTVPSHASLIYGSTAVVALVFSSSLGYERLKIHKVIAILLALAGLIFVVSESPTPLLGTENFAGDLLIVISMIAWAAYTVLGKPMVVKYGSVQATVTVLFLGSLMGLPFLIAPAIAQDYSIVTWRGWMGTAYTGIMISAISYILWFALLKRIDPSQVAILTTPQPVVATTLSVLLLKESVGFSLVIGGLLVIGGVMFMQAPAWIERRRNASAGAVETGGPS